MRAAGRRAVAIEQRRGAGRITQIVQGAHAAQPNQRGIVIADLERLQADIGPRRKNLVNRCGNPHGVCGIAVPGDSQQFPDPAARIAGRCRKGRACRQDRSGKGSLSRGAQHADAVVNVTRFAKHARSWVNPLRNRVLSIDQTKPGQEHQSRLRRNQQQLPRRLGRTVVPQQRVHPRVMIGRGENLRQARREGRLAKVVHRSAPPNGTAKFDSFGATKFEQRQRLARAGRIADRGITIEIGGDARSRHIPAFQRPFSITPQLGLFRKPGIAQQKACIVIEQEAIRSAQLLPSRHRLGHRTGRQGSLGGPGAVPVSPVLRDCGYRSHCQACQQQSKCRANHAGHSWQRLLIRR